MESIQDVDSPVGATDDVTEFDVVVIDSDVVKTVVLSTVADVVPGASDEVSVEQPVIPLHLL